MLLGCVTYNVLKDMDVETIIRTLESTGYEAVELRTGHKHGVEPTLSKPDRERLVRRFERSKVRLLSYGTTCEFHSPDAAERRRQIELAKQFIDLAHDTGAWGVKVRPNGLPKDVPVDVTVGRIGESLRELGDVGAGKGVEIWLEVHGPATQNPPVAAAILKKANHEQVGACWNCNPTDLVNGSIKPSFDLLRPYIKSCHINELITGYPYRELFQLLNKAKYERYTLCECPETTQPERFLRYYRALWSELQRP